MVIARTLLLALALLSSLLLADDALAGFAPVEHAVVAVVGNDLLAGASTGGLASPAFPADVALVRAGSIGETPKALMLRTTRAGPETSARTGLDSVSRHGFSLRTALLGAGAVASAAVAFAVRRRTAR